MLAWLKVLAVLFFVPVAAVVFFQFAPRLEGDRLKDDFHKYIDAKSEWTLAEKGQKNDFVNGLDLMGACSGTTADGGRLIEEMQLQDVCADFKHFQWAQLAGIVLTAFGLFHLLAIFSLSRAAGRSKESLLRTFRLGWTWATFSSLTILLGQTALSVYTLFYLSVLLSGHYFPKLLLAIVIGGGYAFYQSCKLLFTKLPIESVERSSQPVTDYDAPRLWDTVRSLASKLQTDPPDNILVGMSDAFYVTEFPVKHARGVTAGRTLHLSAPLMQQMPLDEIEAIIGHELGHFKGDDTKMTRELGPRLLKSDHTMEHMAGAGAIGLPAFYAMNVFRFFFEREISSYRREREFHADASGAGLTSNHTLATSLVRYSYHAEAYNTALGRHLKSDVPLQEALTSAQTELRDNSDFWDHVMRQQVPHPFDTHPPMAARIEKMGCRFEDLRYAALKPVSGSAYDHLLGRDKNILQSAVEEHTTLVNRAKEQLQVRDLSDDSMDGRTRLETLFPKVEFLPRRARFFIIVAVFALLSIGLPLLLLNTGNFDQVGRLICVAVMVGGVYLCRSYWRDNYGQTLTLTADGLKLSTWKETLKFAEIKEMRVVSNNGVDNLQLFLKEKRAPLAMRPIIRWKRKMYAIDLTAFQGKTADNVNQIYRYYTRSLPGQ